MKSKEFLNEGWFDRKPKIVKPTHTVNKSLRDEDGRRLSKGTLVVMGADERFPYSILDQNRVDTGQLAYLRPWDVDPILDEEDDGENPYKSVSRIKRQVIPTSHKPSKLQELCASKNIKRGDNVFVGDDKEHCVFVRAGEKMIHVHNYATNQTEAVDPKEVYIQEGFKYMPIIDNKKKVAATVTETDEFDRFPEYMGGYVPPFNILGNLVEDKNGVTVARCESKYFARVVAIALNEHIRRK